MGEFLLPIGFFGIIAILAGVVLTISAKIFAVETDERVDKLMEVLPQINCGACGYAGCESYAVGLIEESATTNLCKPGGAEVSAKISEILGTQALETVREVAFVRCNGNCNATGKKYDYLGEKTCAAVKRFYGGQGECSYGCDGYGDCVFACDSDAIKIIDGIAVINPNKCIACEQCVSACPNNLIVVRKASQIIDVACRSKDTGKVVRSTCKNGCIGCKICEKKCPENAITVNDLHASIDYTKCTLCGICVSICPTKSIIQYT